MDWNRIKDDIGILIFAGILAFTIILSAASMLNTERILDYRIWQAKQEMINWRR
jgi:hypothetical protein